MASPETSFLPQELAQQLAAMGEVDLLVGIPSYNNARTIGHVVQAVEAGLARYFPAERSLVLNSDGGSKDGTPEVVRAASLATENLLLAQTPLYPIHRLTTPYHGIPGKGTALRTVFAAAAITNAKACAAVDADLRSITPEWVELLLAPVLRRGFDFVAPLYFRHKYDGTITNAIVYPLTRALYGRKVRQPIGGDFGFSGRLARHWLAQEVWETDVARFGIDIWMTTTAITGGFAVCQSFLGAKIHDPKDPGADLSAMLVQVTGALFELMGLHRASWWGTRGSQPVPTFGLEYTVGLQPVRVNTKRMLGIFRTGVRELAEVWARILHPETWREVASLGSAPEHRFRFPAPLWARVLYDFAVAYHRRVVQRNHLLRALTPLYLGRTVSFVLETAHADALQVEAIIEAVCQEFEKAKPYLEERWQATLGGAP